MRAANPIDGPPLVLAAGSMLDVAADDVVRAAAAAGFDAVGLRVTDRHRAGPADARAVRELADDLGLYVHDVEVVRIGDPSAEPSRVIEAAVALGARSILVVSDLRDLPATIDQIARLVDECRPAGIAVAVEYMAWTTPDSPDAAIEIALATDCRVVVDVLHHHRVGAGVEALERIVGTGVLGWVQLCDAPHRSDGDLVVEARHGRLPPGDGELPLRSLLAAVPTATVISVEVQSDRLSSVPPHQRAMILAEAARSTLGAAGHEPSSTG